MRSASENVSRLQMQLNDMQLENQILKNILNREGISYSQELMRFKSAEEADAYDPDQGKRILHHAVNGKMNITLSNGIYIDNTNLKPALQNKIRRMAVISNPVYYKNQAIGTLNYDMPSRRGQRKKF